jgi:hypothetical protein
MKPMHDEEQIRFYRGLRNGVLLCIPFWVLILWLIFGCGIAQGEEYRNPLAETEYEQYDFQHLTIVFQSARN